MAAPAEAIVEGKVILGGAYADGPPNTNPYAFVGRLPSTGGGKSCSASLVAPSLALSAGHCSIKVGDTIVFGVLNWTRYTHGTEGVTRKVKKIAYQKDAPAFTKIVGSNGASTVLLELDEPVTSILPVTLAGPGDKKLWAKKAALTTLGWGYTNSTCISGGRKGKVSTTLRSASMKITDTAVSTGIYRGLAKVQNIRGYPTHGDSGGPLVARTNSGALVQVGIYEAGVGGNCAVNNYAFYYNRIWPQKKLLAYIAANQAVQPSAQNVACVSEAEGIALYWDKPRPKPGFTFTGYTIQMDGEGTYPLDPNTSVYAIYELAPKSKHSFVITAKGTPDIGASVRVACSALGPEI